MVFVLTALINMRGVLAAMTKKSNQTFIAVLLCWMAIAPAATAQLSLRPMSGSEISQILIGQLLTGEYPSGSQWAERFNSNETSDYSENGKARRGIMKLNGNILCFEYPEDPEQSGGCFEVWKRGANCFDFYSSSAAASLDQRRFGRAWDARGWISDQASTCRSEVIS